MKHLNNIDLNKNELQNAAMHKLASAPSSPVKGQTYFNTTENKPYVYDGSTWKSMLDSDSGITDLSGNTAEEGKAFVSASISGRTLTFEKGSFLTAHQNIKKLKTDNTTSQSTSSSEDIAGSGNINLHKIAKTGSYSDLLDKPEVGGSSSSNATNMLNLDSGTYIWKANTYIKFGNTTYKKDGNDGVIIVTKSSTGLYIQSDAVLTDDAGGCPNMGGLFEYVFNPSTGAAVNTFPYYRGFINEGSGNNVYAPTTAGTSGQVLKSNGSGAPIWGTDANDNQTLKADSKTFGANDNVEIKAGTNVTISADNTSSQKSITISSSYTDTNTWRKVQLNGTDKLGTGTDTNPLNLKAGNNISITESNGEFTFAVTGLSSAMQFIGVSTTDPASSGATISGHSSWAKGEVVLYKRSGETNYEEYINLDGNNTSSSWELLGDADDYALKTINISAGTGLTGGGTLEQNRTLSLADGYGDTKNPYASKNKNLVLATPTSESGVPSFRALDASDIPDLSSTYLTSHQSIKTIDTTATTTQTTNASEAVAGTGKITLHKVSKTGSYNDLLDKPTIPTDTNTWRPVKVNGTQKLSSDISGNALDLVAGTNITLSESGGAVTINATSSIQKYSADNPSLTQSSGLCTWTVTHSLGTKDVVVGIEEVSTGEVVIADIVKTSTNVVTIKIVSSSNISAGTYRVTVIG